MRKLIYIFTVLPAVFFTSKAYAQGGYTFQNSQGIYADLVNDTELSYEPASFGYYHSLDMDFPIFNRVASFKEVPSVPSRGAFADPNGYLAIYDAPGYTNTIVVYALYNSLVNRIPGVSRVSAKIEGSAGNRIVKYQWKNMGFDSIPTNRLNVQAWFHEGDNSISLHYGPVTLASGTANDLYGIGMLVFNANFTALLNQWNIGGNPASPVVQTGETVFSNIAAMVATPAEGTIYTFKRTPSAVPVLSAGSSGFSVYPNPVKNFIEIKAEGDIKVETIEVYDIAGRKQLSISKPNDRVDMSSLSPGFYFLRVNNEAAFVKISKE